MGGMGTRRVDGVGEWEGGLGMGKRWGNVRRCKMVDVGDVGGWGGGEMDGMGGEGRIVERRGR